MDNSGVTYNCSVDDVLRYDVVVIQKQKLQIFIAFNTPPPIFDVGKSIALTKTVFSQKINKLGLFTNIC